MGFRTIVIKNKCKLTYQNNCMLVKNDEVNKIYLDEIDTIVVDTLMVSITAILICELTTRNINIIFCDEKHNPKSTLTNLYGAYNTSKKITMQTNWKEETKGIVWGHIVSQKIKNQGKILNLMNIKSDDINEYLDNIEINDATNREAIYAKYYFKKLFGDSFTRSDTSDINNALNFGYMILLSYLNRSIIANGYITQLGIKHKNEFNKFNLGCDLMEPFRAIIDRTIYLNRYVSLGRELKYKIIHTMNDVVIIKGKKEYISNAIDMYIKGVFKALETDDLNNILEFEIIDYEG